MEIQVLLDQLMYTMNDVLSCYGRLKGSKVKEEKMSEKVTLI